MSSSLLSTVVIALIGTCLAIVAVPVSSSVIIDARSSAVSRSAVSPPTRRLVPRQAQSFYRRDLPGGTAFTPRTTIVVDYTDSHRASSAQFYLPSCIKKLNTASDDDGPPAAVVSFDASQTLPIVVVNTFDAHLTSVECKSLAGENTSSSFIALSFDSKDMATEAWNAWSPDQNFHLVTSHSGCNAHDGLGAWRSVCIFMTCFLRTLSHSNTECRQ